MHVRLRPTEILSQEHRVIERVLDCVDVIAQRARRNAALDAASAREALEFLATFADACHHGKEERALFPRMEQRGIPRHVGPLAVMLHEHEVGRAAIRGMREALERFERGETAAAPDFADAAEQYVGLLHEHIAKEDQVLFPMAEACLGEPDREAVLARFEETETKDLPPGTHRRMLALADTLCERFGIARESCEPSSSAQCGSSKPGGSCCCG